MGRYFCGHCNLFDDDTSKLQYHCDDCGICRVGGRANMQHCKGCNVCNPKTSNHTCLSGAWEGDCCVCLEVRYTTMPLPVSTYSLVCLITLFIPGAGNTALVQLAQARDSCQLWPRRSLGVPRQAPQVTQVHQVAWWSFTLITPDTPFTHAQGDVPTVQQVHGGRRRHHCPH